MNILIIGKHCFAYVTAQSKLPMFLMTKQVRPPDKFTEALHHVHGKGFLHNDLKANNVVLEKRKDATMQ